jgi:Lysozyme like domain
MPRRRPHHAIIRPRSLRGLGGLPADQIRAYAAAAGFTGSDLDTAVAVALAESGGNPSIIGDRTLAPTRGPSIGLWQINIGSKANPQFASSNLADPQTNANAAFAIYSAIGGFGTTRGWTTYTSGAYSAYLAPAAADPSPFNTTTTPGDASASSVPALTPLTIDAATGLPIDDGTATPLLAAGISPNYLLLVGLAFGAYLVFDALAE